MGVIVVRQEWIEGDCRNALALLRVSQGDQVYCLEVPIRTAGRELLDSIPESFADWYGSTPWGEGQWACAELIIRGHSLDRIYFIVQV